MRNELTSGWCVTLAAYLHFARLFDEELATCTASVLCMTTCAVMGVGVNMTAHAVIGVGVNMTAGAVMGVDDLRRQ